MRSEVMRSEVSGYCARASPGKPRLQDVAVLAGVSLKTVSNVINGFAYVSDATRERVEAAIAQTGYRPNLAARNLAKGRAGMIALVVPQVDMPYFASLARHVLDTAAEHDLTVLIHQTLDDVEVERRVLSGDLGRRLDGIVFSPRRVTVAEIAGRSDSTPLVLLGDNDYEGVADHVVNDDDVPYGRASMPTLATVSPDRAAVTRAAVEALLAQLGGRTAPVLTVLPHRLLVRESTTGIDATPVPPVASRP